MSVGMYADPNIVTPTISGDLSFTESTTVTMECTSPNSDIYYTTDGVTDPRCDCPAAPEYTHPITITETTIIKAAAYDGNDWSAVAEVTFTKVPASDPATTVYDWANATGSTLLGAQGVGISTVKINQNANEVNCLKFSSSYVYDDGKYVTIKPAEGAFKAGDTVKVAVCFNNSDDTKYCMVDFYAADGATRLFRTDSVTTINGRTKAANPAIQNYVLETDQNTLLLGRYGNTTMCVTSLQVVRPAEGSDTPDPTAVENTTADAKAEKVVKRIVDGQLIIEREGKMYNANGIEIK